MRSTSMLLLASLLLSACGGEEFQDLRDFVKNAGADLRGKVDPPPEIKPYEPFTYDNYNACKAFFAWVQFRNGFPFFSMYSILALVLSVASNSIKLRRSKSSSHCSSTRLPASTSPPHITSATRQPIL